MDVGVWSQPKKKKAKQQTAPKVISPNVSSDEDSDFIVASKSSIANKSSYRSAAKQKSPSPSISSESHSESVDTLSDSESKSSAENDKEVGRSSVILITAVYALLTFSYYSRLAVWLNNTLASINVVALRQTRLLPGWVTICGRVNHLGM